MSQQTESRPKPTYIFSWGKCLAQLTMGMSLVQGSVCCQPGMAVSSCCLAAGLWVRPSALVWHCSDRTGPLIPVMCRLNRPCSCNWHLHKGSRRCDSSRAVVRVKARHNVGNWLQLELQEDNSGKWHHSRHDEAYAA